MKTLNFIFLLGWMAVSFGASAQSLGEMVQKAAISLSDKSYAFASTPKYDAAKSAQKSRSQAPMDGEASPSGLIHLVAKAGDNSIDAYLKGGKGLVKTPEGWKTLDQLQQSSQDGPRSPANLIATVLRNYKAPARLAEDLAGKATDLKENAGAITGDLPVGTVKEIMTFGASGNGGPEVSNPSGTVAFWVKNGQLSKMEVHVTGKVTFSGVDYEVDRTTIYEITNVGKVEIKVPEEIKDKLN